jgi:hypothetical protein
LAINIEGIIEQLTVRRTSSFIKKSFNANDHEHKSAPRTEQINKSDKSGCQN